MKVIPYNPPLFVYNMALAVGNANIRAAIKQCDQGADMVRLVENDPFKDWNLELTCDPNSLGMMSPGITSKRGALYLVARPRALLLPTNPARYKFT